MFTKVYTKSHLNGNVMEHADGTTDLYVECFCKSTDTKPTDLPNAAPCLEMDTKKLFMFDADTKTWLPQN